MAEAAKNSSDIGCQQSNQSWFLLFLEAIRPRLRIVVSFYALRFHQFSLLSLGSYIFHLLQSFGKSICRRFAAWNGFHRVGIISLTFIPASIERANIKNRFYCKTFFVLRFLSLQPTRASRITFCLLKTLLGRRKSGFGILWLVLIWCNVYDVSLMLLVPQG